MAKSGKRLRQMQEKLEPGKQYPLSDALSFLKENGAVKFDQSVDIAVNLGIDAKKSDQMVRGAVLLPNGTGRTVRVAVFAKDDKATEATKAGADIVGMEDLAEQVKKGQMDFDVVIATPDAMRIVGTLGQILGPRGLMPNPKVGTVTADIKTAVTNAKTGQITYRSDKAGIVHATIGKVSFEVKKLKENIETLLSALVKAKPSSAKGIYTKKITLSSTMGPGLIVDQSTLDA